MKRIEAIIKVDKLNSVVDALGKIGVIGLTVSRSQGRGTGERPEIGGGRGTTKYVSAYSNSNTLITVVDDSKVDPVVSAITDAASTGKKGDGKIFICSIDELVDIATKKKGEGNI
jgi:nitrogen regulatory protein P-II 1